MLIYAYKPGNKLADHLRRSGVEAHDIEHPASVAVSDGEAVADHTRHDELGSDAHLLAILLPRLGRMHPCVAQFVPLLHLLIVATKLLPKMEGEAG